MDYVSRKMINYGGLQQASGYLDGLNGISLGKIIGKESRKKGCLLSTPVVALKQLRHEEHCSWILGSPLIFKYLKESLAGTFLCICPNMWLYEENDFPSMCNEQGHRTYPRALEVGQCNDGTLADPLHCLACIKLTCLFRATCRQIINATKLPVDRNGDFPTGKYHFSNNFLKAKDQIQNFPKYLWYCL